MRDRASKAAKVVQMHKCRKIPDSDGSKEKWMVRNISKVKFESCCNFPLFFKTGRILNIHWPCHIYCMHPWLPKHFLKSLCPIDTMACSNVMRTSNTEVSKWHHQPNCRCNVTVWCLSMLPLLVLQIVRGAPWQQNIQQLPEQCLPYSKKHTTKWIFR